MGLERKSYYDMLDKARNELLKEYLQNKVDENERKLTMFFQDLKTWGATKDQNFLDEQAFELVRKSVSIKNPNFNSYLKKYGGVSMEKQISKIMSGVGKAVADTAHHFPITQKNIQVGQIQEATTEISKKFFEKVVTNPNIKKSLMQQQAITGKYTLSNVQQKVDLSGEPLSSIVVSTEANQQLLEIFEILKNCRFQVKNYAPTTWIRNKETGKGEQKKYIGSYNLQFGKSKYRFYFSILQALGNNINEVENSYKWAVSNYQKNKELRKIIWQFKIIYEITGKGVINKNNFQLLDEVNYIIFNDPSSDFIVVKSAKSLISDLLSVIDTQSKIPGNPFTASVVVDKSIFGWVPNS